MKNWNVYTEINRNFSGSTLECRIKEHTRLFFSSSNSPLCVLIWVCALINFWPFLKFVLIQWLENLSANLILTSQDKNLIFNGWLCNDRIIPCAVNCACAFTFHSTLCTYLGLCVYSFARILLLCVLIWDCVFIWHSRVLILPFECTLLVSFGFHEVLWVSLGFLRVS